MKAIRYIIFIPIMILIIGTLYTLLPMALFEIIKLSKIWLIIMLIFFGGLVLALFELLPLGVGWLSSRISPNENFGYYSILIISIPLCIIQIYGYWTSPILTGNGFGYFIGTILTCLTIGIATRFCIGAGIPESTSERGHLFESIVNIFYISFSIGTIVFYIGIALAFCLLTANICFINPHKNYTWYSGIWHGIFVIPNWIISWFTNDIYCKAPNSSTAYSIWWWISFILVGLGIFGGSSRKI